MTLELKELFRIGRRSLAIGFTVLFLSVLAGQTIARKIEPRALGKVIEESCSYSPGWRIGARSKSFSTISGRSSAGATSIAGWGRPKWSSGLTGRAMSGAKSCPRNEGGCWRRRWSSRPSRQMPGAGAARPIFGRPGKPARTEWPHLSEQPVISFPQPSGHLPAHVHLDQGELREILRVDLVEVSCRKTDCGAILDGADRGAARTEVHHRHLPEAIALLQDSEEVFLSVP
jgi:hypothetical protein